MAPSTVSKSGQFRPTGSMTKARSLHTATALSTGRVLIAGGHDAAMATLASAEVYDPLTGVFTATWVQPPVTPKAPVNSMYRREHGLRRAAAAAAALSAPAACRPQGPATRPLTWDAAGS